MSFGFSIGDIIKLVELTTQTYNGWKNACGTYATVTNDLAVLRMLLSRMEAEAKTPNSLFSSNDVDLQHWKSLYEDCYKVIKDLASILDKYKSLSKSRAKNWDRIRLDNKKLARLEARLSRKIEGITAFTVVIGISSQGRVENVEFPELQRKVDMIAAEMRRGNRSICTISTYDDDDKIVWKEFQREMIRADVKIGYIHKYKVALKTCLLRLQREGSLDEEEAPQSPHEDVSDNSQQEKSVVEGEKSSKRRTTIDFCAKIPTLMPTLPPRNRPPSLRIDSNESKGADSPQVPPDTNKAARKDFRYVWLSPDIISVIERPWGPYSTPWSIVNIPEIKLFGFNLHGFSSDFRLFPSEHSDEQMVDRASELLSKVMQANINKKNAFYLLAVLPASQVSPQLLGRFNSARLKEVPDEVSLLQGVDEFIESDTDIYTFMDYYIGMPRCVYFATWQCISEYLSGPSDETFHSYAKRLLDGVSPHEQEEKQNSKMI